jgi:DNA-binding XRE family transcriptional regulator
MPSAAIASRSNARIAAACWNATGKDRTARVPDREGKKTVEPHNVVPFGVRLKQLRAQRGLTIEQLARAADLTLNAVARIERGERQPSWQTACKLADALRVSVAELR